MQGPGRSGQGARSQGSGGIPDQPGTQPVALTDCGCHAREIDTHIPRERRDASRWVAGILVVAALGVAIIASWALGDHVRPSGVPATWWIEPIVTLISYGAAGAVLVDRRPDLSFGWLLGGTAAFLVIGYAVMLPAASAVASGERGPLALWGLTGSAFLFLPIAVQGLVNVRFPTGYPASRRGAWLEKAIIVGTTLVVLRAFLGSTAISEVVGDNSSVRIH